MHYSQALLLPRLETTQRAAVSVPVRFLHRFLAALDCVHGDSICWVLGREEELYLRLEVPGSQYAQAYLCESIVNDPDLRHQMVSQWLASYLHNQCYLVRSYLDRRDQVDYPVHSQYR